MTRGSVPSSWMGAHPSPLSVVRVVVSAVPFVLLNIPDAAAIGDTDIGGDEEDVFVVIVAEGVVEFAMSVSSEALFASMDSCSLQL